MIAIDGYELDMSVKEEHEFPSEVTKLAIEDGADLSDHNREKNEKVTIEGIISDTPIATGDGDEEEDDGNDEEPSNGSPSEEARDKFIQLRTTRKPVTIVTMRGVYESMALISFKSSDSKDNFGGLFFTLEFEKQRIVTVERVAIARAQPNTGLGNRASKATETTGYVMQNQGFWLDPDLTVFVPAGFADTAFLRPDQEADIVARGTRPLAAYQVWRKSAKTDNKTHLTTTTKGALRNGFINNDELMRLHVKALTVAQRVALKPPAGGGGTKPVNQVPTTSRESKQRVFPDGSVGTINQDDPRWKDTKPFIKK